MILFWSESVICVYLIIRNRSLYRYVGTYPIQRLGEGSCLF